MPILDLQKRARELGRIRMGQVTKSGGKTRPEKLDRFRFTSASKPLLDIVAGLYGGKVAQWQPQGGGPAAWEVVTEAKRVPILVPPQPVSQWYELWSGGGCQRRCDGERDVLSDRPCPCAAEDRRVCQPTTRLNVVLADVEGIGVWRLESHGFYAAVELPNAAAFLEKAGAYVEGALTLEERVVKRDGKTRRFMVPGIEITGVTPRELMAGQPRAELPTGRDYIAEIGQAGTRDAVLSVWNAARAAAAPNAAAVEQAAIARVEELRLAIERAPEDTTAAAEPAPEQDEDVSQVDELWNEIVAAWPGESVADIETAFAQRYEGVLPDTGTVAQLAEFLAAIKAGQVPVYNGDEDA